jgi:hypothetical protein
MRILFVFSRMAITELLRSYSGCVKHVIFDAEAYLEIRRMWATTAYWRQRAVCCAAKRTFKCTQKICEDRHWTEWSRESFAKQWISSVSHASRTKHSTVWLHASHVHVCEWLDHCHTFCLRVCLRMDWARCKADVT